MSSGNISARRNIPPRYPNLKIVIPHCGAYLPLAIPRMKSLAPVMQQTGLVGNIDWEKNLSAFYYDLAGAHSPEVIRMMLSITTPDHLLYGSDYPYVATEQLTASLDRMKDYLTALPDLSPYRDMILGQNALRLFGGTDKAAEPLQSKGTRIVRLAEIEIYPEYQEAYLKTARDVAATSLHEEPGVLCLFPSQLKEDGTKFRIVEIYASQEAYQHHIATAHFLRYKQGTLKMI